MHFSKVWIRLAVLSLIVVAIIKSTPVQHCTSDLIDQANAGQSVSQHNLACAMQAITDSTQDRYIFNQNSTDFAQLAQDGKLFAAIHSASLHTPLDSANNIKFALLQHSLYPFINPTIKSEGKGIVMSVGNGQTKLAIHSIHVIRIIHKCTLPIQVFFNGPSDLSKENQDKLSRLPGVSVTDMQSTIKQSIKYSHESQLSISKPSSDTLMHLSGWATKPFCILYAAFTEVVLIDADSVFLQSPEVLFDDPSYLKTGALFFKDRLLGKWSNGQVFAREHIKKPSKVLKESLFWKGETAHYQESGVVVVNKSKRVLHGLLMACRLVGMHENEMFSVFHGEKEAYWFASELVGVEYAMMDLYGGVVGALKNKGAVKRDSGDSGVCGHILHFDRFKQALWWNGSVVRDKYADKESLGIFDYYAYDEGNISEWDLGDKDESACFYTHGSLSRKYHFAQKTRDQIQEMITIWKEMA